MIKLVDGDNRALLMDDDFLYEYIAAAIEDRGQLTILYIGREQIALTGEGFKDK